LLIDIYIYMNLTTDFNYPEYTNVINILKNINYEHLYTHADHNNLSMIWANIDHTNIIHDIGLQIYERGGFIALQENYYILLHVMRTLMQTFAKGNFEKYIHDWYDTKKIVSKIFVGVCGQAISDL
jgi:hypothetical protein